MASIMGNLFKRFMHQSGNQLKDNWKCTENNKEKGRDLDLIGLWAYDFKEKVIFRSEEIYSLLKIKPRNLGNDIKDFYSYVHPDYEEIAILNYEKIINGEEYDVEYKIINGDGEEKLVREKTTFLFDKNNKPIKVFGVIEDISQKKKLMKDAENIKERFDALVQESSDAFAIIDIDGTIRYVSKASEKFFGFTVEESINKNIFEIFKERDLQKIKQIFETAIKKTDKIIEGTVKFKTKSSQDIYLNVYMKSFVNVKSVKGIVVNFRDVTRRVKMEQRMAYITTHDDLTGLPNHIYFKKQLRLDIQRASCNKNTFALMMLDIDGLKDINYSLGYDMGNQLIQAIVDRLMGSCDNIFISRFSDDLFAIIVRDLHTHEDYANIARGIIQLFKYPFKVGQYELDVIANIGICIYPDDAKDSETLRKNAKAALLRAKKEGRYKFKFYYSDLDIQSYKDYLMITHLHHAIENEELKVYYQPIVNIKNNEILAAEALIRWEHPEWGTVSQNEFISLAEETGMIIEIGKWALKKVCKDYVKWCKEKLPDIKISVNFSSVQFLENNFVENIKKIIEEFSLDPKFLIMEITESIIIDQKDKVRESINRLQSYGIQVALDDFGQGFSSLAYLNTLNINILKIDKSFIKNSTKDETSRIIISSIVDMARKLKMSVITEGVETKEQLYFLRQLNCKAVQGFLYSKALPLEEFEKVLAIGKCKPVDTYSIIQIEKERRKYFRIEFPQLLEADMTIKEIKGKEINVGRTKILISNIGPGGIGFISNIQMPVDRYFIIQCTTELMGEKIEVLGHLSWSEEIDNNLYKYGLEFIIDENERCNLVKILNQIQIKMRKDILFAEGTFTSYTAKTYFKQIS